MMVLLAVLLAACGGDYVTAYDALESPDRYDGDVVTLRGWARILRTTTLKACEPVTCDCNGTNLELVLVPSPEWSVLDGAILVEGVEGSGNSCEVEVAGFDPTAPAYELVGRFDLVEGGSAVLSELDLDASSELRGKGTLDDLERAPLSVGPHTCGCGGAFLDACIGPELMLSCAAE